MPVVKATWPLARGTEAGNNTPVIIIPYFDLHCLLFLYVQYDTNGKKQKANHHTANKNSKVVTEQGGRWAEVAWVAIGEMKGS